MGGGDGGWTLIIKCQPYSYALWLHKHNAVPIATQSTGWCSIGQVRQYGAVASTAGDGRAGTVNERAEKRGEPSSYAIVLASLLTHLLIFAEGAI